MYSFHSSILVGCQAAGGSKLPRHRSSAIPRVV